jgi:hypothetical protein
MREGGIPSVSCAWLMVADKRMGPVYAGGGGWKGKGEGGRGVDIGSDTWHCERGWNHGPMLHHRGHARGQ